MFVIYLLQARWLVHCSFVYTLTFLLYTIKKILKLISHTSRHIYWLSNHQQRSTKIGLLNYDILRLYLNTTNEIKFICLSNTFWISSLLGTMSLTLHHTQSVHHVSNSLIKSWYISLSHNEKTGHVCGGLIMREYKYRAVFSYCDRPTPILISIKTTPASLQGIYCTRSCQAWQDIQTFQICASLI